MKVKGYNEWQEKITSMLNQGFDLLTKHFEENNISRIEFTFDDYAPMVENVFDVCVDQEKVMVLELKYDKETKSVMMKLRGFDDMWFGIEELTITDIWDILWAVNDKYNEVETNA